MKAIKIGNLEIRLPIIQGGMGVGISLSGLASAVANEGGVGVISAVGIGMTEANYRKNVRQSNLTAFRKQIRIARSKTTGAVGVNIMLAITDFDDMLRVALQEKVDLVFIGAGLPLRKPTSIDPDLLENGHTQIIPKVSSAKAARLLFQFWSKKYNRVPSAVVVEGPLSGGHQGFSKEELADPGISLSQIVRSTVAELEVFEFKYGNEIPIIAAGGIYTGEDAFRIMEQGAKAVKMGSRFVTTHECDAAQEFKDFYIQSKKEDITIIDSPVGLPGRVIKNTFVDGINNGANKPVKCPWHCLRTCDFKKVKFCIAEALFNAAEGRIDKGIVFAGTKAYMAQKIVSVKDTIESIKYEYQYAKQNSFAFAEYAI